MIKTLFGNQVAIRPIVEEEEKSLGGIVIPGKKGTQKLIGEVVAVGLGMMLNDGSRAPMDIKVGMKVVYKQYAGVNISAGDETLLVLSAADIIAEVE